MSKKHCMPDAVKARLRARAKELKEAKRKDDPVPSSFSLVDMMAAVDWAREDNGYGQEADRPYLNLDGEGKYNQRAGFLIHPTPHSTAAPLLGYLRYARELDAYLAQHLLHHMILKSAGPGERLVHVYRLETLLAVTRFLAPNSKGPWSKPSAKYVGFMDRGEYHVWALWTLDRTDRVRKLLEKARKK